MKPLDLDDTIYLLFGMNPFNLCDMEWVDGVTSVNLANAGECSAFQPLYYFGLSCDCSTVLKTEPSPERSSTQVGLSQSWSDSSIYIANAR